MSSRGLSNSREAPTGSLQEFAASVVLISAGNIGLYIEESGRFQQSLERIHPIVAQFSSKK